MCCSIPWIYKNFDKLLTLGLLRRESNKMKQYRQRMKAKSIKDNDTILKHLI
jgi:hypothetical protein